MKILIIEDEFNLADAICTMLEKEKYQVDKITNGTYNIYTGGSISDEEQNDIYTSGSYTKGTLLKTVKVSSTITKG